MSALDRLESRRSRKGNGEAAVGEKKERVEIAPGVYGTKVVGEGETAAQEPQGTLNKRQTKQSLKEYLANKGVQETPKTTRKPVPRKK